MERMLKLSLENEIVFEMIYQSDANKMTQRFFKVLEINESYFVAYCYLRKGKRFFKKDNVLSIQPARNRKKGA